MAAFEASKLWKGLSGCPFRVGEARGGRSGGGGSGRSGGSLCTSPSQIFDFQSFYPFIWNFPRASDELGRLLISE